MWPDGEFGRNDPSLCRREIRELQKILDMLVTLNRTGLYTAFFEFHGHTGTLDIHIYQGRWGIFKTPTWKIVIDCRKYPLVNFNTEEPFYAQDFLEWLILQVQ